MHTPHIISRKIIWLTILLVTTLLAGLFGGVPLPGKAASLVVNSGADDAQAHDQNPGDGVCADFYGGCTLRAAIEEANALPGADVIIFNISLTIYLNEGALPEITDPLVIDASSRWNSTLDQPGMTIDGVDGSFYSLKLSADSCSIYGLQIVNSGGGIYISSSSNTIGGAGTGQRNVISGNWDGIRIDGSSAQSNLVYSNYIGLTPDGQGANPNKIGVAISGGASNNLIGGSPYALGNFISGNESNGVVIEDPGTDGNWLINNGIGVTADLSAALGNGAFGIAIRNGATNTIIGNGDATGNLISANQFGGIDLWNAGSGNQIRNNLIGSNLYDGISITDSVDCVISNNVIINNTSNGVKVVGAASTGNLIWENSITGNQLKGIYLQNAGNLNLAAPIIQTVSNNSASGTACVGCSVTIYSDPNDEGQTLSGTTTADGVGNWNYNGALPGPNITALATDSGNNTSEFSAPFSLSHKIFLPLVIK